MIHSKFYVLYAKVDKEQKNSKLTLFYHALLLHKAFLCLGYSLEELMKVTEAAKKIRESRRANLKNFHANNKWNKFVNVFELAAKGVMDNAVTNLVTKSIRVSIRVANDATTATLNAAASTLTMTISRT